MLPDGQQHHRSHTSRHKQQTLCYSPDSDAPEVGATPPSPPSDPTDEVDIEPVGDAPPPPDSTDLPSGRSGNVTVEFIVTVSGEQKLLQLLQLTCGYFGNRKRRLKKLSRECGDTWEICQTLLLHFADALRCSKDVAKCIKA
eukprot:1160783-Pelagomonas_calceolata.AAC.4